MRALGFLRRNSTLVGDPLIHLRNSVALKNKTKAEIALQHCVQVGELALKRLDGGLLSKVLHLTQSPSVSKLAMDITKKDSNPETSLVASIVAAADPSDAIAYLSSLVRKEGNLTTKSSLRQQPEIIEGLVDNFCRNGHAKAAASIVEFALANQIELRKSILKQFIESCGDTKNLELAEKIRGQYARPSELYDSLMAAYAKCGMATKVNRIFDSMEKESLIPTASSWSSLIRAYLRSGQVSKTEETLEFVKRKGIVLENSVLLDLIVDFGKKRELNKAIRMFYHNERKQGWYPIADMYLALVGAYVQVGDVLSAWKVFRQFRETPEKLLSKRNINYKLLAPLAEAHVDKHPDFLRDMLKFSGNRPPVGDIVTFLMNSLVATENYNGALSIYEQYKSPSLSLAEPQSNQNEQQAVYHASKGNLERSKAHSERIEDDALVKLKIDLLSHVTSMQRLSVDDLKTRFDSKDLNPDMATYELFFKADAKQEKSLAESELMPFAKKMIEASLVPRDSDAASIAAVQRLGLRWQHEEIFS